MATAALIRPRLRRGRPPEWSEERVREELLAFVGGSRQMPTAMALDLAGRSDLRYAIGAYGGTEYWAGELCLELSPRQLHSRAPEWVLLDQARKLANAFDHLPGANKLRQLGYADLATLVRRSGGSRGLCQRLGIEYVDGRTSAVRRKRG